MSKTEEDNMNSQASKTEEDMNSQTSKTEEDMNSQTSKAEEDINSQMLNNAIHLEQMSPNYSALLNDNAEKVSKREIIKNLIAASFGLLLVYAAFLTIISVQSSIIKDKGIGMTAVGIGYFLNIPCAMFLSTPTINYLGVKKTLVLSGILYSGYTAVNFYPNWYTMMLGSCFLALGATFLWTAHKVYTAEIAKHYSTITRSPVEIVTARFFGVTFVITMLGYAVGSLVFHFVLQQSTTSHNYLNNSLTRVCGAQFCPAEKNLVKRNSSLERPDDLVIYALLGSFTVSPLLGAVLFGMVMTGGEIEKKQYNTLKESLKSLIETVKHLKNNYLKLLIPLTLYCGLEKAYFLADYTQAFIGCALGIPNIGYVTMYFGICSAVAFACVEFVMKVVGDVGIFAIAAAIHFSTLITMLVWQPTDERIPLSVISGLWGLSEMAWQCNISSLYGILFADRKVSAYSNMRTWFSTGHFLAFVYSKYLCTYIKIYISICILGLGMICYFAIEIHRRHIKTISK